MPSQQTVEELIQSLEREGKRITIDASNGRVRIAMSHPGSEGCCSPMAEPVIRDIVPDGTIWLLEDELRDLAKAVDAATTERRRRAEAAKVL